MLVSFSYLIVIASVFGGFYFAGGHLAVLWQPLEILTIVGGAVGAFLLSNGIKGARQCGKDLRLALRKDEFGKSYNVDLLSMLYLMLSRMKTAGQVAVEADIESPKESELFKKFPLLVKDEETLDFLVDYLRLLLMSNSTSAEEISTLMDHDIKTRKKAKLKSSLAIQKCADGLPAFGIVAAIMGVVHVMGSVGRVSNAELGMLVAGALVGTFLGILLSYGFVGPLAGIIEARANRDMKKYEAIKTVLIADLSGSSPRLAVEFGRKSLYPETRPEFSELEGKLKEMRTSVASPAMNAPQGGQRKVA